jgi:beta-D-xylosidase 4
MCAYNAVQGVPSCLSPMLKLARDQWGFDGYVTSDTDAVQLAYTSHHYTDSLAEATGLALRDGGCDINSGDTYNSSMLDAVQQGYCSMDDVNRALFNSMKIRFRLGLFDPIDDQPLWKITPDELGKQENLDLSLELSEKSLVLLRNDNVLPIPVGVKIAVVGPHGNARQALIQTYPFEPACNSTAIPRRNATDSYSCIISPFEQISNLNVGGKTLYAAGCDMYAEDTSGFQDAIDIASDADYIVMGLGIEPCGMDPKHNSAHSGKCLQGAATSRYVYPDGYMELEAHDRLSIDLPPIQHEFAEQILRLRKPTLIFLINAGMVAFEAEDNFPSARLAIMEAFYPGHFGGVAIANAIFGKSNRFGRLPFTIYPASFVNETLMSEHDLRADSGRTYRYHTKTPLYPFGAGLSLTTFRLKMIPPRVTTISTTGSDVLTFVVVANNTGMRTGDVVITAFFSPTSLPTQTANRVQKQLFGFERIDNAHPFSPVSVTFEVSRETLALVSEDGNILSVPGTFIVSFEDGSGQSVTQTVEVKGPEVILEKYPTPQ